MQEQCDRNSLEAMGERLITYVHEYYVYVRIDVSCEVLEWSKWKEIDTGLAGDHRHCTHMGIWDYSQMLGWSKLFRLS